MKNSWRSTLAITTGLGLTVLPVLSGAQGSAFAAPIERTQSLCSQLPTERYSWDRNICFNITTSLPQTAQPGDSVTYLISLEPLAEHFGWYWVDEYADSEPYTPLEFTLTASPNFSGLSATASSTATTVSVDGQAIRVRADAPVASTIEVIGTVDGADSDPFGFGFASAEVEGCMTELTPWKVNNSGSESSEESEAPPIGELIPPSEDEYR